MGNLCTCFAPRTTTAQKKRQVRQITSPHSGSRSGNNGWSRIRSLSRKDKLDKVNVQEQAIAAAMLFKQHQQQSSLLLDRSSSVRYSSSGSKKSNSTSRSRSLADPHRLLKQSQNVKLEDLETSHFVLVHGGGFGAWCWYKTIALLEEDGFKVTAIDLTGSGIDSFDTNCITNLSQYAKPLTDFFNQLTDGEKVILAGHDFGGACITYAMESFPLKISKAVFIAATMLTNGQSILDVMQSQEGSNHLMQQAQIFVYANGKDSAPTTINLDRLFLKELLFNQSLGKDIALASVLMRSIPFAPILEKLYLSTTKYGSVRRFYIQTPYDNAITITLQESMIKASNPEMVFYLKGADHTPFFSKPQALHKLFIDISKIAPICHEEKDS